MKNDELKNIDAEDIEDLLFKIEESLNIKFDTNELSHIVTFGEFCDYITDKIQLETSDDCTSQQAFYKLREAISVSLKIDKGSISADLQLFDFLPKKYRRKNIKGIEDYLGFKLRILQPKRWIVIVLCILFFGSFVGLFIHWKIGILGILFSILGLRIANKTGNELNLETVGEVAKKIARENYLKSRRNPNTVNKKEIEKVLRDLFSNELYLSEEKLTRETVFRE